MSQVQTDDFIESMKNNEGFRETVIGIDNVVEKTEYLNREGLSFTSDELMHAAYKVLAKE